MKSASWFEVDREGLAKLGERRGKGWVLFELLQNCWDAAGTTQVNVLLERAGRFCTLTVTDNSPDGFRNLRDCYTLFAPSEKRRDPERRGRFNLGEKLVLALCESACIESTTGTVVFDARGRRERKGRREAGTQFVARLKMTADEMDQTLALARTLIPDCPTWVNGDRLATRLAFKQLFHQLPTERADGRGVLRQVDRTTKVSFYQAVNETPTLYEMGIPVCPMGERFPFHVNVHQKVPLTLERDNVRPAFLSRVRALGLDQLHTYLSTDQASDPWVTAALGTASKPAIERVVFQRFGARAVIADPSDREATNLATAQGYTVVAGGSLPKAAWDAVRAAGVLKPAGQVTPSPKPFSPEGEELAVVDPDKWRAGWSRFSRLAWQVADRLMHIDLIVRFTLDRAWGFNAAYSKLGPRTGLLTINARRLGDRWFDDPADQVDRFRLLIHELAHHEGHHLETSYHDACCRLGAGLTVAALQPGWLTPHVGAAR